MYGTTESIAGDGGLGSLNLILEALDEMELADVLEADSVLEILTILADADLQCGNMEVNKLSGTIVYTITGGEECVFTSGIITIRNISKTGDEISFDVEFDDVQSEDCSINGPANITASKNSSAQIEISVEFEDVTTCNGTIDGSIEAVIDSDDELISSEADIAASYMVDGTEVDVDTDNLTYDETDGLNGDVYLTLDGSEFHCVLDSVVIDQTCGVPTEGTLTIKSSGSNGLENDVIFDFSSTTCANPTVETTINGRTVTYYLL